MIDVRCICAIGLRGQLGLNGHLPWEGNTDPLFVEDVTRFFALTMGHVLIAGPNGSRTGARYATGVVLTALVIVVCLVLFGRAISLPTKPRLDASLDLPVGVALVLLAAAVLVRGRRRGRRRGCRGRR